MHFLFIFHHLRNCDGGALDSTHSPTYSNSQCNATLVWLHRVSDATALSRCLSRYTGYPYVSVLLANWLLYATRQDRHRHQLISSHCSYIPHVPSRPLRSSHTPRLTVPRTRPLFLPAVLSLSLHRPFGTHCRTMLSTRTPFKKRLKIHLFHCVIMRANANKCE